MVSHFNALMPRHNGQLVAGNIFKCNLVNETNYGIIHWHIYASRGLSDAETKWPSFCRRHFECILLNEKHSSLIQTSLNFVSKSPLAIGNKVSQVRLIFWCRTGGKSLPESMMTQFSDTYMRLLLEIHLVKHIFRMIAIFQCGAYGEE